MPFITVSVDDPRHPNHDEVLEFMDNSAIADFDDFKEISPDEEVEVEFDEWRDYVGF